MSRLAALVLVICGTIAWGQGVPIDDFTSIDDWNVIEADGVQLQASVEQEPGGLQVMRLEYDFTRGAGYCIVQKKLDLPLPENYAFTFAVRGQGPANNLEFKLVSPSGEDVWWVNRRGYVPPPEWMVLRNKRRHFEFAWGPSGPTPLDRVGAIEIAISASEGGTGVVEIAGLNFEALPATTEPGSARAVLKTRNDLDVGAPLLVLGELQRDRVGWRVEGGRSQELVIEYERPVEFGAIELAWAEGQSPAQYWIAIDEGALADCRRVDTEGSTRQSVFMPESEASRVRVIIDAQGFGSTAVAELESVRLVPVSAAPNANAYWTGVARSAELGRFPRSMVGQRSAWTVVGLADGPHEALISEFGAVETIRGGWSIEPMLLADGKLITWADAAITHSLLDGMLPVPSVRWETGELGLDVTALADGQIDRARLVVLYRVTNNGADRQSVRLALCARPFQVLPPAQQLNLVGGFTPLREAIATTDGLILNAGPEVHVRPCPDRWAAGTLATGGIAASLLADSPASLPVTDVGGEASAAMVFDLDLAPGESRDVVLTASIGGGGTVEPMDPAHFGSALNGVRERWDALLGMPRIEIPGGEDLVQTFHTAIADILINRDGPAIQPGSRTYERSWIRDGALTSLALIMAGQGDRAKEFVEWYAPFQYESGKVPCVVDHRGPDPVDEHDSTGELIFAIRNAAAATGDDDLLRRLYPHVVKGVDYLQALRAQRQTREYTESDDPVLRACVGLVPESISHEGYSAKPMHSYWDDFWVLRGFQDAEAIARTLGRDDDAARFAAIAAEFQQDLVRSIESSAARTGATYITGCVELGDFDATSTSIAVAPLGQMDQLPARLLRGTFDKYWEFFVARRDGHRPWEDMTPYEVRIVGTLVRLGEPERAHTLLDWMMTLRSPEGWNQWGEIAYRDTEPGRYVGDMPHTWVASGFVLSFLSMFGYEQGGAVIVAPALAPAWVEGGMSVSGLWTRYGPLSYGASRQDGALVIDLSEAPDAPGGLKVRTENLTLIDGSPARPVGGFVAVPAGARRVVITPPIP